MSEHVMNQNGAASAKKPGIFVRILAWLGKLVLVVLSLAVTAALLAVMVMGTGSGSSSSQTGSADATIMDKFDMYITNKISSALDGVLAIEKVYWLSDNDLVAPKPKDSGFGEAKSASELGWLLEEAADLIGDSEMLFTTETEVWEGDKIYYYYDETILVVVWKQIINRSVYTMAEVKIAHASQFRRFLAGGEFGSDKQYVTTEMAASVNAVMSTSGDFYKYRRNGIVVYEGEIRRVDTNLVDTCFINEDGDLLFAYRGDLSGEGEAEAFVKENKVRYSLCFGPILVDNGVACPPKQYALGEIHDPYTRGSICQMGKLHYLVVRSGGETAFQNRQTIYEFAAVLESFGCEKAYALDGGQTTVITMRNRLLTEPDFQSQRQISDIIYFATALPDGE